MIVLIIPYLCISVLVVTGLTVGATAALVRDRIDCAWREALADLERYDRQPT